jgi:hypothetical protein
MLAMPCPRRKFSLFITSEIKREILIQQEDTTNIELSYSVCVVYLSVWIFGFLNSKHSSFIFDH